MAAEVVVLGGCVLDIISSAKPLIPATSNPGVVSIQSGGVGRNIAEALTRLGVRTLLVAPIGDDAAAETLRQQCKSFQMVCWEFIAQLERRGLAHQPNDDKDVSGLVPSVGSRTAVYSALLDGEGELLYGVVDSSIFDFYHFHQLSSYFDQIRQARLVVLDANASVEFMLTASTFCAENNVPVFFEGTSVQKSTKLSSAGSLLSNITWLCPNLRELIAIYYSTLNGASSSSHSYHQHAKKLDACTSLQDFLATGNGSSYGMENDKGNRRRRKKKALELNDLSLYQRMIARLFELGVRKWIVVKMGTKGALSAERVAVDVLRYDIRFTHFPIFHTTQLANVLGAGDNLVAGLIFGILRENLSVKDSVPYGLLAAKLCVESPCAVPRDLTADKLKKELQAAPKLFEACSKLL